MITLIKGQENTIYYTASENKLLGDPFFLFVFTNTVGENVIAIPVENVSTSARYDKSVIETSGTFDDEDAGYWTYKIYEQESPSNEDPTGLNLVEEGYMNLKEATEFEFSEYDEQDNSFKTYTVE